MARPAAHRSPADIRPRCSGSAHATTASYGGVSLASYGGVCCLCLSGRGLESVQPRVHVDTDHCAPRVLARVGERVRVRNSHDHDTYLLREHIWGCLSTRPRVTNFPSCTETIAFTHVSQCSQGEAQQQMRRVHGPFARDRRQAQTGSRRAGRRRLAWAARHTAPRRWLVCRARADDEPPVIVRVDAGVRSVSLVRAVGHRGRVFGRRTDDGCAAAWRGQHQRWAAASVIILHSAWAARGAVQGGLSRTSFGWR